MDYSRYCERRRQEFHVERVNQTPAIVDVLALKLICEGVNEMQSNILGLQNLSANSDGGKQRAPMSMWSFMCGGTVNSMISFYVCK